MIVRIHAVAAVVAMALIATFLMATLSAGLAGDAADMVAVKRYIAIGLLVLVPALAATGASGFALSRHRQGRLVDVKLWRMKVIAANGLLVLVPCAIALWLLSQGGRMGLLFDVIETIEIVAGAANLCLMTLNARDGLRLTGRARRVAASARPARVGVE